MDVTMESLQQKYTTRQVDAIVGHQLNGYEIKEVIESELKKVVAVKGNEERLLFISEKII